MKRLTLIAISFLLATAACSGGDDSNRDGWTSEAPTRAADGPDPSAEPQTVEAAEAMAVENGKRFGAQDFAGSWEFFDKAGKAAIPKDEYVEYATVCDIGGVPLEVDDIRLDSPTEATVRYEALGLMQARSLVYEDGGWKGKVSKDTLKLFKKGTAEAAIQATEANGRC